MSTLIGEETSEYERQRRLDIDGNTVKIGDRVLCVDNDQSFGRLSVGNIYTVEPMWDGAPSVMVNRADHSLDRFRLVRS